LGEKNCARGGRTVESKYSETERKKEKKKETTTP